jgi:hypothetical protein
MAGPGSWRFVERQSASCQARDQIGNNCTVAPEQVASNPLEI